MIISLNLFCCMDLKFGMFLKLIRKVCMKDESFQFPSIYKNSMVDKSQVSFLKYILGVNRSASNLAVMSETGRLNAFISYYFYC